MASKAWCTRKGRSSSWIRRTRRLAIYLRDGFVCSYCGTDLREAEPRNIGLDHLEPQDLCRPRGNKTKAGLSMHHASNLVTACRSCNSGRQDRVWTEYATPGAVARIRRNLRRKLNLRLARALLDGHVRWEDR